MSLVPGSNSGLFGIPPGGPWFVFPFSGTVQRQDNPVLAEGLAVSGWIGFPTQELATNYAHNQSPAHAVDQTVHTTAGLIAEATNPALWLRFAEVVLGVVLIAVGLAKLTGVSNKIERLAGSAGKAAGEAAVLA